MFIVTFFFTFLLFFYLIAKLRLRVLILRHIGVSRSLVKQVDVCAGGAARLIVVRTEEFFEKKF